MHQFSIPYIYYHRGCPREGLYNKTFLCYNSRGNKNPYDLTEKDMIFMNSRKILTAVLAVCMVAALLTSAIYAVEPSYNVSDDYKDTKYYDNLLSYELTGDQVTDVIAIALSQMGYHEGNNDAGKDGLSSGSKNFVEYNVLFGKLDNGEGNGVSYGYAWCAAFVNWCLRQAGVDKELTGGMYVSCNSWRNWFINEGAKFGASYHNRTDDYIPQPGDLIFYKSLTATHSRATDHIGIVLKSENGKVYAIEGNGDNRVGLHEYELDNKYIVGYGTIAYKTAEVPAVDYYAEDDYKPGFYISGTGVIGAYKGPSSSSGKITNLSIFGVQRVLRVQGKYGLIQLEDGSNAWISLKRFTPMSTDPYYTVTFANGEATYQIKVAKGSECTVPETDALADALGDLTRLQGWSLGESGTDALLAAGSVLTLEGDVTLYAIMEQETTEEPTTEEITTEAPTEAPTEEITTEAPDKGCGGILSAGVIGLVLMLAAAFVAKKKD